MRLALLGDIHGNASALEAVLSAAKSFGVQYLLITGDIVGYYFEPLSVIQQLEGWNNIIVRGNHENMLCTARYESAYLKKITSLYGSGIQEALNQLSNIQLDEICDLPLSLEVNIGGCQILLCHGSPEDVNEYVYPDASHEELQKYANSKLNLVVMGHTHHPMTHVVGETQIVNPGSVGQPRNGFPGAHWALYDTISNIAELRNEKYDRGELIVDCQMRHPELPYLSKILERTK